MAELSAADKQLSAEAQAQILAYKEAWEKANAAGDAEAMAAAHAGAEAVRSAAGYSGGADGTQTNAVASVGTPAYAAATGGKTAEEVAAWLEAYKAANQAYDRDRGYDYWNNGYSVSMNLRSMANYIRQQMQANSEAWHTADPETRAYLHDQNLELEALLRRYNGGAESHYDDATGQWTTYNGNYGYGKNIGKTYDDDFDSLFGVTPEMVETWQNDTDRYRNFIDQSLFRNLVNEDSGYTGIYNSFSNGPMTMYLGGQPMQSEFDYDAIGDGYGVDDPMELIKMAAKGEKHTAHVKDHLTVSDYTRQMLGAVDQYGIIRSGQRSANNAKGRGLDASAYTGEKYDSGYTYDPYTETGSFKPGYAENPLAVGSNTQGQVQYTPEALEEAMRPNVGQSGNEQVLLGGGNNRPAQNTQGSQTGGIVGGVTGGAAGGTTTGGTTTGSNPLSGYGGAASVYNYTGAYDLPGGGWFSDYINAIYDAQNNAELAALAEAYEANLSGLKTAEEQAAAQYEERRRQTAGQAARDQASWNELAVAQGLNSGTIGQARLAQNNQLQSDITTLQTAEAANKAEIEQQRALLGKEFQLAIIEAAANNDYERAMMLYQEAVRQEELLMAQEEAAADRSMSMFQTLLSAATKGGGGSSASSSRVSGSSGGTYTNPVGSNTIDLYGEKVFGTDLTGKTLDDETRRVYVSDNNGDLLMYTPDRVKELLASGDVVKTNNNGVTEYYWKNKTY